MPHSLDLVSYRTPPTLLADRVGILFMLVPLIEKGKQCNDKDPYGNQKGCRVLDCRENLVRCH